MTKTGGAESAPLTPSERKADPRLIAAIVASALFMQNLDSSAVTTALPAMARDLAVEPARLGAAITSYLVALTVFIPVSGWVADRFGAKRVFMAAIVVFTAASVLCGRATGVPELIAARVLQGLGGAMMVPVARLLLLRQIRKEEMLSAMAWLTMPAMIGPISGPPLGGFLTDAFGWRSVFLINVPIGALGLLLVAWKIPRVPPGNPGPPDRVGLALIGTALALFMFGVETIGRGVVPQDMPQAGLVLGLMFGWAAMRHCRRAARPALDLSLLRIPTFNQSTLAGSLFRIGAGTSPFLVPMLLQVGFGKTASEAGMVSFATALGALAMKPLARPILKRFGFRTALIGASLIAAVGVALPAAFTPAWPLPVIFAVLALGGLFRSLQFTALNTLAFADVPSARLSAATSFAGTAQQLTQALGVVLATTTLEASALVAGRHALAVHDFTLAFLVAGVVVAASAPFFARLAPEAGEAVSGHRVTPAAKRLPAE
ncbi:MDR family MFS transporter [Paracraurococcus lichenis]|uniref:MDR family MFS transporter n=1 Tax=Paracraurococcus lichenis TaxID=3064888 RepID=A0ABT9DZJ6_9PROT|nr:MDR family MFS transporter [Paracraurococcus sp. LOR1-02]MDO9709170.1 MDR family MFS transporter [Paracraurococcus sp. LOR1-02]